MLLNDSNGGACRRAEGKQVEGGENEDRQRARKGILASWMLTLIVKARL